MDQGPPEHRALNTDVILRIILNQLDTETLLYSCRLVNQKFWKESTSILKVKYKLWLKSFCLTTKEFYKLYSYAITSKHFPFNGLILTMDSGKAFKDLETPKAQKFFQSFGPCFQHLRLITFSCGESEFVKILQSYLPNIQTLELGKVQIHPHQGGAIDCDLTLPTIRRIKLLPYEDDSGTITIIEMGFLLRAAPNLQAIDGLKTLSPAIMGMLSLTNKWNKVKSLSLTKIYPSYDRFLQAIIEDPPSLTHLTLGSIYNEIFPLFRTCVRAILSASEDTLQSLSVGGYLLVVLDMPVRLRRLKRLTFEPHARLDSFDIRFTSHSVAQVFPALKEIQCGQTFWIMPTGITEGIVWNSVEKLELNFRYPRPQSEVSSYLMSAFPSVKQVVIDVSRDYRDEVGRAGLQYLWDVGKLLSLERLVIKGLDLGPYGVHFDEFFTGMPRVICSNLSKKAEKMDICGPCGEIMRPYGGIQLLRGSRLKELVLWMPNGLRGESDGQDPPISIASVWYGLEYVPGLRVTVQIRGQTGSSRALEAISQFVRVDYIGNRRHSLGPFHS